MTTYKVKNYWTDEILFTTTNYIDALNFVTKTQHNTGITCRLCAYNPILDKKK